MKNFTFILALLVSSTAAFVPLQQQQQQQQLATLSTTQLFVQQIDDKTEVREYFNSEGFNRWNKIYSESDDVNTVQLDIRTGHDQTIQKILNWIQADGDIAGKTVCDCGCGVGSLAIPLAQMGKNFINACLFVWFVCVSIAACCKRFRMLLLGPINLHIIYVFSLSKVLYLLKIENLTCEYFYNKFLFYTGAKISASDISDAMAGEADRRAKALGIKNAEFYSSDLESVTGKYDTVTCVDVAIHYPTEKMTEMITHLCSLAEDRVIISFAPKTWYYSALKKVGEFFPGPSKTTRAYLHEEEIVVKDLKAAGFEVARDEMTGTNFYFSRLLEAKRV